MAYNPILGLPPGVTAGTSQKSMEDSRGNHTQGCAIFQLSMISDR